MNYLPIKSIREEDTLMVGQQLVLLGKLSHLGFPIAEGIIVLPPEFNLKFHLENFQIQDLEVFEQRLDVIKREFFKTPIPEDLEKILISKKIDPAKLWKNLLESWLGEIRSVFLRVGFERGLLSRLSAQPVFFTSKIICSGEAYFDYKAGKLIFSTDKGSLSEKLEAQLQDVIKKGDKKLFLPQVYHFIIDTSLKLIKLKPFTDSLEGSMIQSISAEEQIIRKTSGAVKVFLTLGEDLTIDPNVDGILIEGERINDFDKKAIQLMESASLMGERPVIYKLSNFSDRFGGVRGTQRLIHQESVLKKDVGAILFVRNKKQLLNVQVGIPHVRSLGEFLELKKILNTYGISRKGSLKLWLEIAVPENVINLEKYIDGGVDGVIININELSAWLGGFDPSHSEIYFYQKQIELISSFLEPALKILHKQNLPFLVTGDQVMHSDMLRFLVSKGVWGIAVDQPNILSFDDYLNLLEKHNLRSIHT